MEHIMRTMIASIAMLFLGTVAASAQADPYRWCAEYGGWRGGSASNCYFMTLAQCQATISGVGGTCRPNPFYTGPKQQPRRKKKQQ
jgi:hypothetical protein